MAEKVIQIREPKSPPSEPKGFARQNILSLATLVAVVLSIVIGFLMRGQPKEWSQRSIMYLQFPGEIFLRMLRCLVLPLIVSSVISSLGSLDTKLSGRIGRRIILYYLWTTISAIFLGIVLVLVIRPGYVGKVAESGRVNKRMAVTTQDSVLDLIRNMFPSNLVEACFHQDSTSLTPDKHEEDIYKWKINPTTANGTNILGLIVFSIVLGIVIGRMKAEGKPLLNFFGTLSEAMLKITQIVINFTPIGVMFLVMSRIVAVEDVSSLISSVGLFGLTVVIGLLIHGLIILPTMYYLFVRKNPYIFLVRMSEALLTAFGTSSSSATLPITISCLEEKNKVDRNVVRLCAPIGAVINLDGTGLYEAVAALFIAQTRGVELDLLKVIIISITATVASLGASGIPHAGWVTMVIVLNTLGLPAEDVALVIVIDWLLDRIRTTINVLGDAYGSGIVEHLNGTELKELANRQQSETEDDILHSKMEMP